MRPADTIIERLWSIAEPVCTNSGYELVDIVHTQSPQGWVLRVFIDHAPVADLLHQDGSTQDRSTQDSSTIDLSDCERISRELSAILDVEDPLNHAYNLEVSSPGLDRPLRKPSHFQRYLGQIAKVTLRDGLDGRKNFKGTLVAVAANEPDSPDSAESDRAEPLNPGTLVMKVDGTEYRLPFHDINSARLVPDWDELFRGQRKR